MFENDVNKGLLCFVNIEISKQLQIKEGVETTKVTINEQNDVFFNNEAILCAQQLASEPSQVVLLIYKRAFVVIFDRLTKEPISQIHCPTSSSAFNVLLPVMK